MTWLQRTWSAWLKFLTHREPATGLAILRIVLGVAVLYELGAPILTDVVPLLWLTAEDGGYRAASGDGGWRFAVFGGYSPTAVWIVLSIGLTAASAMVIGLGGRLAAFLALQCFIGITDLNLSAGGSDDYLLANLLWLMVLADSTATGSLRSRWRAGQFWSNTPTPAWPRYLVIFQMVVMYFTTGLQKMSAHWVPWGDLSALYYIVQQPTWQRFPLDPSPVYPVTQVMTLTVWLWEIGSPVLLLAMWFHYTASREGRLRRLFRRLRVRDIFLAVGVGMHAGIFLTMRVGMFSIVSVAAYACAFHADELAQVARRLRRRPVT